MTNADGRVVINFEFPISEVESSKRKIDKILQSLGENAGEDYKKSFTKNADAVKQHAEKTSKEISDKLGKDRITSTYVENTIASIIPYSLVRDHLHIRGEHSKRSLIYQHP